MRFKSMLLGVAASALVSTAAGAASSPVTGTVNVTGFVDPTCTVDIGTVTSATDWGTIALGQLNKADGTLDTALSGATNTDVSFRIICNSATPTVDVTATALYDGVASPPAGYTSVVNYTATVDVTTTGTPGTVANTSAGTDAVPTATSTASSTILTAPLAAAGNNVTVTVSNPTTAAASDVLTAGTYNGQISITISPT